MPLTTYTAGQVLTAASLNANFTFAAANPVGGLTFISSTTITAANTASLPASSFTSTYQNYLLVVTTSAMSAGGNLSFRYRASGTDDSGSTYNTGGFNVTTGGTIGSDSISGASQSSHRVGYYGGSDYPMMQITLFNPQGASNSRFNSVLSGVNSTAAAVAVNYSGGIMYTNTQYDSLTLIMSGATTMTGTARLYGYLNS